jgi:hypothetical protein
MNKIPKLVFSKPLKTADWNNTTLIKENASAEIKRIKEEGDNDMYALGKCKPVWDFTKR